jgi:hypothetical protein
MTTKPRTHCPDCKGALHEIRLIDKSHAGAHTDMQYASVESKRSLWRGTYPIEGTVDAYLCAECGRIVLYAAPVSQE